MRDSELLAEIQQDPKHLGYGQRLIDAAADIAAGNLAADQLVPPPEEDIPDPELPPVPEDVSDDDRPAAEAAREATLTTLRAATQAERDRRRQLQLDRQLAHAQRMRVLLAFHEIAELLNTTYAGVDVVYRTSIARSELLACYDGGEVLALSAAAISLLEQLTRDEVIVTASAPTRALLQQIFASCPKTTAAVEQTWIVPDPTRAADLWGHGASPIIEDIVRVLEPPTAA